MTLFPSLLWPRIRTQIKLKSLTITGICIIMLVNSSTSNLSRKSTLENRDENNKSQSVVWSVYRVFCRITIRQGGAYRQGGGGRRYRRKKRRILRKVSAILIYHGCCHCAISEAFYKNCEWGSKVLFSQLVTSVKGGFSSMYLFSYSLSSVTLKWFCFPTAALSKSPELLLTPTGCFAGHSFVFDSIYLAHVTRAIGSDSLSVVRPDIQIR